MKQFYVYLHCKPDLTPFYVGKGSGNRSHYFGKQRCAAHRCIVDEIGRENIVVMVFKKDSEESALRSERRMIKMFRDAGFPLVNQSIGGQGGATGFKRGPQTDEHKAKAAASRSASTKGRPGRPQSPESIAKIRAARALQVMGPVSDETRLKLSLSKIGNQNGVGNKGRWHSKPQESASINKTVSSS